MKFSLSLGLGAALLSHFSPVAHGFPTAENLLKLGTPEEIHESLLRMKEKRLLFDPLTKPIDGG